MKHSLKRSLQRVVLQPHQCQLPNASGELVPVAKSTVIPLTPEQKHYLGRVLRLEAGSDFFALDNMGQWWLAQLQVGLDQATLLEEITLTKELSVAVTCAIAMPKGNTIESVIRQTTELGVSQIIPLWSDRTAIRAGTDLGEHKLGRWKRIAQEASEQSLRSYVPEILQPQTLHDFATPDIYTHKYLCVTRDRVPHLLTCLQKADIHAITEGKILIATGPEGGWTDLEQEWAIAHDFQPVSLGDRILAAVTAPVVALAIVSAVLNAHDYP